MVKFCHETKTGHLIAIALEKSKSKASWRNTFSLNSFSDWPKNCKDLCAIYKLGWNLPQYANGFKPHSQLKQKTFLLRDMSFLQRVVSHCVCRVGHTTHWFGAFVSFCITTLTQLHMISSCPCPATYSKSNHASVLAFHNAMVKLQAWITNLASHREQTYSQLIKSMAWGTFLGNIPRDSIDFLKKKFHAVTIFIEFSSGSRLWSISP